MATNKRFVAKNGVDNNSKTITNVADPVSSQDAATKAYVDSRPGGLSLQSTNANGVVYLNASSQATTSTKVTYAETSGLPRLSVGTPGFFTSVFGHEINISHTDFVGHAIRNSSAGTGANSGIVFANDANTTNTYSGYLGLSSSTSSNPSAVALGSNASLRLEAGTVLSAVVNAAERVRITSAGDVGIGTISPVAKLDVNGSLNISGSARRITGDFSNNVLANRVSFQSSTTNGTTGINIIPNGTNVITGLASFNSSNPDNASYIGLFVNSNITQLASAQTGTGSHLPLAFLTNNSERMRIETTGNINVNSNKITNLATPTAATDAANKSYVDNSAEFVATQTINLLSNSNSANVVYLDATHFGKILRITTTETSGQGSIVLPPISSVPTDGKQNITIMNNSGKSFSILIGPGGTTDTISDRTNIFFPRGVLQVDRRGIVTLRVIDGAWQLINEDDIVNVTRTANTQLHCAIQVNGDGTIPDFGKRGYLTLTVTRTGVGRYTLTMPSTLWSGNPQIVFTAADDGNPFSRFFSYNTTAAFPGNTSAFVRVTNAAGTLVDTSFFAIISYPTANIP